MCGVGGAMDFRTMQNKLRRGRKCGSGRGGGEVGLVTMLWTLC